MVVWAGSSVLRWGTYWVPYNVRQAFFSRHKTKLMMEDGVDHRAPEREAVRGEIGDFRVDEVGRRQIQPLQAGALIDRADALV